MEPKTEKLGKEEHAESSKTISGYIENPIVEVIEDARGFLGKLSDYVEPPQILDHMLRARRFQGTYRGRFVLVTEETYLRSQMRKVKRENGNVPHI